MHFKLSSSKWRPFCPGVDELTVTSTGFDVFFVSSLNMLLNKQPSNGNDLQWWERQPQLWTGSIGQCGHVSPVFLGTPWRKVTWFTHDFPANDNNRPEIS